MKAVCASEGLKWPVKLIRLSSTKLPRDQKLPEGWIWWSNPHPDFQWEK